MKTVLVVIVLLFCHLSQDARSNPTQSNISDKVYVVTHGIEFKLEAKLVTGRKGLPFGIMAEVSNLSKDKYLYMPVATGAIELFHVVLIDEQGLPVSPYPSLNHTQDKKSQQKYVRIAPNSTRVFRISLPDKMRSDPTGLTNDKLVPLPAGTYRLILWFRGVYFIGEMEEKIVDRQEILQMFKLSLDLGWAGIVPEYVGD
ncbi:MAG: hypothetical protein GX811_12255 [Lentisphaerae bacterium]|nr:hypothetical protein [Lentisphaerota bacterium]